MSNNKGNTLYYGELITRVRNSIMKARKQVVKIAHCVHLVLHYEHDTGNSEDHTLS